MIYTNLFKPNKSDKTKNIIYYMVESRRYKFNLIFDKKFTSMLSAIALGSFMIASVNVGIYLITTSSNAAKLASLEDGNNNYLSSLAQLESQQQEYIKQKANVDNIYNISDKPTKWSSIIDDIAEQLPYDTVLTSLTTISADDIESLDANPETPNTNQPNSQNPNGATPNADGTTPNPNGTTDQNSAATGDANNQATLDEQLKNDENIEENNVIEITGKSLSMVNLSLFLDKLDKLDIFSKVECLKSERDINSNYYVFLIHAYLN